MSNPNITPAVEKNEREATITLLISSNRLTAD
jgi:hypothetical protein